MLTHPTHDRLIALGLAGMARSLEEQRKQPDIEALAFEERLGLMIDREAIERENRRLATRLKFAGLRQNAIVEDINFKATRGLDKTLFHKLIAGDWIDRKHNLIIIGPTGIGKAGSPARSATRPVAMAAPCSTSASPGCSMLLLWPAETAATPASSGASRASNC
jgi:hypothetical protein